MPPSQTLPKTYTLYLRDMRGGIALDYVGGNAASIEAAANQYAQSNGVSLMRPGYIGHISPAEVFSLSGITNAAIDSIPRVQANDVRSIPNSFYVLGGLSGTAPRVIKAISGSYDSNNVIAPHGGHNFTTIPSGTGFWGEDAVVYNAMVGGNPKICLFYSWNDNSDGDVGRLDIDSATYSDSFMSTVAASGAVLTTNVPHRLKEGPDKKLYVTNGRYVAQFDGLTGNDGTYNATAYDLGAGWIATDISWEGNLIVIAAVHAGSFNYYSYDSISKVCYWDGVEPGLGIVYDIPDSFISALVRGPTGVLCFTTGKNGSGKIMDVKTGKILPGGEWMTSLYGTPPKPNQVDIYQGHIVWCPGDNTGGYVLGYNLEKKGIHVPWIANDGSGDASATGFLKNADGGNLYCGMVVAGTYKISRANGFGSYASSRNFKTRVIRLPYRGNIVRVRVYFSQFGSGASCQTSLFRNYKTASVGVAGMDEFAAKSDKTLTNTANGAITEYEWGGLTIANCSAFYMNFRISGPVSIAMVEIEYSPSR